MISNFEFSTFLYSLLSISFISNFFCFLSSEEVLFARVLFAELLFVEFSIILLVLVELDSLLLSEEISSISSDNSSFS